MIRSSLFVAWHGQIGWGNPTYNNGLHQSKRWGHLWHVKWHEQPWEDTIGHISPRSKRRVSIIVKQDFWGRRDGVPYCASEWGDWGVIALLERHVYRALFDCESPFVQKEIRQNNDKKIATILMK